MEKVIIIPTKDRHLIYGTLNWRAPRPKSLIIFVHGLTGYEHEAKFLNAARLFIKKELATFRMNLYSWKDGARVLTDCTLKTHAQDIRTTIEHFKGLYKNIFLVGHSLGGLSILHTNLSNTNGIVLWDASYGLNRNKKRSKKIRYIPQLKAYVFNGGYEFLYGKKMRDEIMALEEISYQNLIRNIHVPIKIIVAEKGILVKGGKKYFQHANEPKAFAIIKNATHNFVEEGAEEQLFRETLSWMKKYSRHNS